MNIERPGQPLYQSAHAVQCGALCWSIKKDRLRILLITSRDTGRWIIPKGWIMPGKSAQQAAGIEAWEEAGVEGCIGNEALGSYSYTKHLAKNESIPVNVSVYPLRVIRVSARFPEHGQRKRKWMTPKKAASVVREVALKEIILGFNTSAGSKKGHRHGNHCLSTPR